MRNRLRLRNQPVAAQIGYVKTGVAGLADTSRGASGSTRMESHGRRARKSRSNRIAGNRMANIARGAYRDMRGRFSNSICAIMASRAFPRNTAGDSGMIE